MMTYVHKHHKYVRWQQGNEVIPQGIGKGALNSMVMA